MEFVSHHSSSNANLYTVTSGDRTLLVEAGVRIKSIRAALNFNSSGIDGCLCSHSHLDHARGIKDLMGAGVDIYASHETFEALGLRGHRANTVEPLQQFKIADYWTALGFPTEHDCPGSLGFLISDGKEKLLFVTDSFYLKYKVPGLNWIAVECNYSDETISPALNPVRRKRLLTSHFSLKNVVSFLKANDLSAVKGIYLLHLSDENSDEESFKRTVQAATGIPTYVCKK